MSEDEKIQEMARQREKALLDEVTAMSGAKREGVFEVAQNLVEMNLPIDQIIKATGLSREEIEKLK
jgi:predicted transposase/invertase (TIGR01784 family)